MATPSVRTGPGGTSSTAPPTPSRTRDWGALRSGEPGSAFRGMTKGRGDGRGGGRGGGGGGRGGRGGRQGGGGARGDQANAPKPDAPAKTNNGPAASSATAPSTPSAVKAPASGPNSEKPSRPKPPSRRASRNVPTLVIAPSSPTVETAPSSAPSRPSNRRRRSQQHGRSPQSAAPPKSGLSVESSPSQTLLRPRQARTGPSTPIAPSKDAPPHLSAAPNVSTFDTHNIDAFVERVRAAASNRPSTPGSHIDWAGDDDDSLPDLDDWGVTTTTTSIIVSEADRNEISPILGDSLKPLPETSTQPSAASAGDVENKNADTQADSAVIVAQDDRTKLKRTALPPKPLDLDSANEEVPNAINSTGTSSPTPKTSAPFSALEPIARSTPLSAPSDSSKFLLHPSLPAKPVAAVESLAAQAKSPKSRNGAAPTRVSVPVRQSPVFEKPAEKPPVAADETAEEPALPVPAVEAQTAEVPAVEAPAVEEPAVIEAPAVEASSQASSDPIGITDSSPENLSSADDTPEKERPGLYESIHAPSSNFSPSTSLPNLSQSTPTAPRNFNPTHHRAQTVGRPNGFSQPNTAPSFQQRFSRSGTSSPRGGFNGHHNRTHSSPPAGSKLNPRVHAHRPVITGDALSRLARSIGGPSPRSKEITTATES